MLVAVVSVTRNSIFPLSGTPSQMSIDNFCFIVLLSLTTAPYAVICFSVSALRWLDSKPAPDVKALAQR